MSNVIKGPWDKRPKEERPRAANERVPGKYDSQFIDHLEHMTAVLVNLQNNATAPSSFSEENVQARQAGLKDYSAEDLRRMIWQSNSIDWAKNPSFYYAVGRELKRKYDLEKEGR